jgi:glutaredoxin
MRVLSCAIVFALLLGAYATTLAGDVYIWKDEQGGVHLGDKPPTDGRGSERVRGSTETKPRSAEGEIELFVTTWCPYCDQAIDYLKSKGLRFKVHDIEKDSKAKRRKQELSKGRGGVPFAMIYGTPITGFSKSTYDKALQGK